MSRVRRWLERLAHEKPIWLARLRRFITTPAGFALGLFIVMVVINCLYPANWPYSTLIKNFYNQFWTEALGILVTVGIIDWLYRVRQREQERQRNIQRWQEEITDYLGWDEKEATYRIVGNIRRLNRERFTKINLSGAYLQKASLSGAKLHGAKLRGANLQGANLLDADLSGGSDLEGVNLSGGILNGARLDEANLTSAILSEATLLGATLRKARLIEANLSRTDLRGTNLRGAKYNTKEYYQIVDHLSDVAISYQPTQWPPDFDPVAAGAIDVSEQPDYPPWLSKRIEDAHWHW